MQVHMYPCLTGRCPAYSAARLALYVQVDPAELDSAALQPNVCHVQLQAAAAVAPILELLGGREVDCLCSDMNMPPTRMLDILRPLLPLVILVERTRLK